MNKEIVFQGWKETCYSTLIKGMRKKRTESIGLLKDALIIVLTHPHFERCTIPIP